MRSRNTEVVVWLFVSGVVTFILLATLVPQLSGWGLVIGIGGGMAIGYLGYRVRDIIAAVPVAARAVRGWQPRRTFGRLPVWLVLAPLEVMLAAGFWTALWGVIQIQDSPWAGALFLMATAMATAALAVLRCPEGFIARPLGRRRASWKRWAGYLADLVGVPCPSDAVELAGILFRYGSLSKRIPIGDCCRLALDVLIGIPVLVVKNAIEIVVWVVKLLPLTPAAIVFLAQVAWGVLALIHSRERLICGVYGPLGGLIAWIAIGGQFPALPPVMKLAAVVAAGLMSVGLGKYLAWPVARRVFHVQPDG